MSYIIPGLPLSFEIETKAMHKQGLLSDILTGKIRVKTDILIKD